MGGQALAGRQANQDRPVVAQPHSRWRERVPERIRDEHDRAVAPDADQAIGRSEIDADDHGQAVQAKAKDVSAMAARVQAKSMLLDAGPHAIAPVQARAMLTITDGSRRHQTTI
jgi:uncharacterized protein YcsI (UPF0317 family)